MIDIASILAECRAGRPEPFRALVERYGPGMRALARGMLGDRTAADDAAQEAFCRAYAALHRLRRPDAFVPWLLGITTRVAREMRRVRRTGRLEEIGDRPAATCSLQRPRIAEAVARLPSRYRDVIVLLYFVGCPRAEAAHLLQLSPAALNKRISRAYALLRDDLRGVELDAPAWEKST